MLPLAYGLRVTVSYLLIHALHPPHATVGGRPADAGLSSFRSTTTHSVVSKSLAIEAAFCNAVRVTLVGSTTPEVTRFSYASLGVIPEVLILRLPHFGQHDRPLAIRVLGDHPK
jgi:hypothetical protein